MDSRSFRLGMFIVFSLVFVVGTIGYFVNEKAKINRDADIKITTIEQNKKLERTKERWAVLPWNRQNNDN